MRAKVTYQLRTTELLDPEFFAEGSADATFCYTRIAMIPFFPRKGDVIAFDRRAGNGCVKYFVEGASFDIESGDLEVALQKSYEDSPALASRAYLDAESLIWDCKDTSLPEQFNDHERSFIGGEVFAASLGGQPRGLVKSKGRFDKIEEEF